MKRFVAVSVLTVFLLQGCAPITSITPKLDEQTAQLDTEYANSLFQGKQDPFVEVLYKVDRRTGKVDVLNVANNHEIGDEVVKLNLRKNVSTEDDYITECVKIDESRYVGCVHLSDSDKDMLSAYYSREYRPVKGFFGTVLWLPVQFAFAIPLSILTLNTADTFGKIEWPQYTERVANREKVGILGRAVDKVLTARLREQYAQTVADPDPSKTVQFLKTFPRFSKAKELHAALPDKYRNRGSEKESSLDFIEAYKLTGERNDILSALKFAKDPRSKGAIEATLVSGFPNKHKLVTATAYGNNLKGARESQGANLFVMNIGAAGVKNAQVGVKVAPASHSPIPFEYSDYKVRVRCNLKLKYSVSAMGAATEKEEHKTREADVILKKGNLWKGQDTCSFGEIVQSGGGSLFGFKYMDIHLTGAEASVEVVDVQPI